LQRIYLIKKCTGCLAFKGVHEFHLNRRNADGFHWKCKPCKSAVDRAGSIKYREQRAAKSKVYRENNKEKIAARDLLHRQANRERLNEYAKEYAKTRTAQKSAYDRAYRERNREKLSEYKRDNYERFREYNRAYLKQWAVDNADRMRSYGRTRRERERAAQTVAFTPGQLDARMAYFGNKCWICKVADFEHVDHVKPLAKGGSHMLSNLRPACARCNCSKKSKWPFTPPCVTVPKATSKEML
tara:strand:- start:3699 stop:4424 length:726 start_codon:yes stop_codon:yes gene_type:complete